MRARDRASRCQVTWLSGLGRAAIHCESVFGDSRPLVDEHLSLRYVFILTIGRLAISR